MWIAGAEQPNHQESLIDNASHMPKCCCGLCENRRPSSLLVRRRARFLSAKERREGASPPLVEGSLMDLECQEVLYDTDDTLPYDPPPMNYKERFGM